MIKLYFNDIKFTFLMVDELNYIERIQPSTLVVNYVTNGKRHKFILIYDNISLVEKDLRKYAK